MRDIVNYLDAQQPKLYHPWSRRGRLGFGGRIARSMLLYADKTRHFSIYADLAAVFLKIALNTVE